MNKNQLDKPKALNNTEAKDVFAAEKPARKHEEKLEKFEAHEAETMRQAIEEEGKKVEQQKKQPELIVKKKPVPQVLQKSQAQQEIEDIMSEDLQDIYTSLPQNLKNEFKTQGELTAQKIEAILRKTKIKVKEIIKLIIEWLKIIPGVNKYFLEQEAKIKTDKILKLKKPHTK